MANEWFRTSIRRSTVIIFWLVVLAIFAGIYFFAPSIFNQMRQATYQNTPYVDTPGVP